MGIVANTSGLTIDFSDISKSTLNTATPTGAYDIEGDPVGIAAYCDYDIHGVTVSYTVLDGEGGTIRGGSYTHQRVTADDPRSKIFETYAPETINEQNYIWSSGSPVTQASSENLFDPPVIESVSTENRTVTFNTGASHAPPTHTKTTSVEMLSLVTLALRAANFENLAANSQTLRVNLSTYNSLTGSYDIHAGRYDYGIALFSSGWSTPAVNFPITDLGDIEPSGNWGDPVDIGVASVSQQCVPVSSFTQSCSPVSEMTKTEVQ